jgi:plasmid stabilization system protein ParE
MKPARILCPAEDELVSAAMYYEEQASGLGIAFLRQVGIALADIKAHPARWPVLRWDIRRRFVSRFPYAVLYRDDPREIVILAVMHLRRQPHYWIDRA